MCKLNLAICFFLLTFITTRVESQIIRQLGYFNVNGVLSLSSKTNLLVTGIGQIIDISDPGTPKLTGTVNRPLYDSAVLVDGDYAYFGTSGIAQLIITDISHPDSPVVIGSKLFPRYYGGSIYGLSKSSNVIYLAMGVDGVFSVDITDKTKPVVLDSIAIPNGQARDIVTQGNFAYVAHFDGLKVIDISDPKNLMLVASIGTAFNSIDINNNLVFLGKHSPGFMSMDSGGFDIINISNPKAPAPVFSMTNINGVSWDIKYRNNLIYLATDNSGLYIYKFDHSAAVEKAHFPNIGNGQSFAVCLQDSLIYLSGLINGIAVLKYDSLGTVYINEKTDIGQLTFSPNPAKDYIDLRQNNENIHTIEITTLNGQSVLKEKSKSTTDRIDISGLAAGNYIVSFKSKTKQWSQKLIKTE